MTMESLYCVECGTKYSRTADACPSCGYRNLKRLAERLPPIQSWLAIVGAILIPAGVAIVLAVFTISDERSRQRAAHPNMEDLLNGNLGREIQRENAIFVGLLWLTVLIELIALICCTIWLYQAWRIVAHGDKDISPGWMIGLMFVPFFNFYWIFRTIPGLSSALQRQLNSLAPTDANSAGWPPGLIACILVLIPYVPVSALAVCMFLVWMIIANNAVKRLVRLHDNLHAETQR